MLPQRFQGSLLRTVPGLPTSESYRQIIKNGESRIPLWNSWIRPARPGVGECASILSSPRKVKIHYSQMSSPWLYHVLRLRVIKQWRKNLGVLFSRLAYQRTIDLITSYPPPQPGICPLNGLYCPALKKLPQSLSIRRYSKNYNEVQCNCFEQVSRQV